MKVPPKRKGNIRNGCAAGAKVRPPSMKVPPKRKGNVTVPVVVRTVNSCPQ